MKHGSLVPYTSFSGGSKPYGVPWKVQMLRRFGFICMGPYHNNMWYVFYGKRALARSHNYTNGNPAITS